MVDRRPLAALCFCLGAALSPCLAAALSRAPAAAQSIEPAEGRRLAENVCNACHQIEPGETEGSPNKDAPSFAAIAGMSSTNELSLKVFLRSSHGKMPNLILSAPETDAVIAYILSLSGK